MRRKYCYYIRAKNNVKKIRELYCKKKKTLKEVAYAMGVSESLIRNVMVENNIRRRSHEQATSLGYENKRRRRWGKSYLRDSLVS